MKNWAKNGLASHRRDALKLVAAEVECVEEGKEGEWRKGVDLVGVQDDAAEPRAPQDRREKGEGVSREVKVVKTLLGSEKTMAKQIWCNTYTQRG